jgi:PAS domain S-box-containing protein
MFFRGIAYLQMNIQDNKNISSKELQDENIFLKNKLESLDAIIQDYKQKLIETDQRYYFIVQNVPDIIYILDESGNIIFISNSVMQYGYSPEELIGKKIFEIVHPEDREKALYRVNERRTGDRSTKYLELRLMKKNSSYVTIEINDKRVLTPQAFQITAEGIYSPNQEKGHVFSGTLGIARDLSNLGSYSLTRNIAEDKHGYIPVCSSCKSIRDKNDEWKQIEQFISENLGVKFTHTICPVCKKGLFLDI